MSAAAASKIFSLQALGLPIPAFWLADENGLPTQDASDWPAKGSMMPMAGHKGYGIALLIEVMAGVLSGAAVLDEATSWMLKPTQKAGLGHSFLVINIGNIVPIEEFKRRVDIMVRKLRESPKAKDAERVYVPGEMEWERRRDSLERGIPLPDLIVASLLETGQDLGLDIAIFVE
jgi:ureidoglycolate dehydrogenase (NAD+)